MRMEIAKAARKCHDPNCQTEIARGEVCGVATEESQYGSKKVFFCKTCTIRGLETKKRIIEEQLDKIRGL